MGYGPAFDLRVKFFRDVEPINTFFAQNPNILVIDIKMALHSEGGGYLIVYSPHLNGKSE